MLSPPPETLHVEATAAETRILLDHGRPPPAMARWKRLALGLWFLTFVLGWFLPFLFCPASVGATIGVVAAFALDARRSEVQGLVLKPQALRVVHRGALGLRVEDVPWERLDRIELSSEAHGRGKDALLLGWSEVAGTVRVAPGRDRSDLAWIRDCLRAVRQRIVASGDDEQAIEEVEEQLDEAGTGTGGATDGDAAHGART